MLNLRSPTRPRRSRAMATTEEVAGSQTTPWKSVGQAETLEGDTQVEKIRSEGSDLMPFLNSSSDRISSWEAETWRWTRRRKRARKRVIVIVIGGGGAMEVSRGEAFSRRGWG